MKFFLLTLGLLILFFQTSAIAQSEAKETPKGFRSLKEYDMIHSENTDELRLLLLLNDDISEAYFLKSEKVLSDFYADLEDENLDRLSESKKIKKLHAFIHDRFLKKYEEISPFHEIFESGTYNCVSATALMSLAMTKLNIPYSIQELPTHVFVIAYPGEKDIMIEMTSTKTKDGSYMPSRKDISKTLNALLDFKLITEQEIAIKGEREVYNDFFYRDQSISLRQLASLQFYNLAITCYDENRMDEAYHAIKKSNILYGGNTDKSAFFLSEILIDFLEGAKLDNMDEIYYLVEYANLPSPNSDKVFYEYSSNVIQKQLIEAGHRKFVDSSFAYIQENLKDDELLKQISQIYYLGMSDYYRNAYNLRKQLEYAELAYETNPENVSTQSWLAKCLVHNLSEKNDGEELVEKMEKAMEKRAFLKKHNFFLMFYFYACTDASNDYYFESEEELGKKYFDLAIITMNNMEDSEVLDQDYVGMLYAEPGAYYCREGRYDEALEVLHTGLKLAPEHERILARIEIAENRKKGGGLKALDDDLLERIYIEKP